MKRAKTPEQRAGLQQELAGPPIPPEGFYLLNWFFEISPGRSHSGFGPLPISASEILAWCALRGVRLSPWEFLTIRDLDALWVKVMTEK